MEWRTAESMWNRSSTARRQRMRSHQPYRVMAKSPTCETNQLEAKLVKSRATWKEAVVVLPVPKDGAIESRSPYTYPKCISRFFIVWFQRMFCSKLTANNDQMDTVKPTRNKIMGQIFTFRLSLNDDSILISIPMMRIHTTRYLIESSKSLTVIVEVGLSNGPSPGHTEYNQRLSCYDDFMVCGRLCATFYLMSFIYINRILHLNRV